MQNNTYHSNYQQQGYGQGYGYSDNGNPNQNEDYSYPPNSGGSSAEYYEKGGSAASFPQQRDPFARQESYGSSTTYDEKSGGMPLGAGEYAKHPLSMHDEGKNNDSVDDLPVPIPRHQKDGSSRPASQFQPGHVSRGSVALLAAAEGKIPKKEGLKMWRSDEHHGTFTRGGKRKTCLRCCGCTILFTFILIVGIVAAFLLWVSRGGFGAVCRHHCARYLR